MSKEGDKIRDFYSEHHNEIRGLYNDKYWRDGGWNGMVNAAGEVAHRYKFRYDDDKLDDDEWETIFNEEFFPK